MSDDNKSKDERTEKQKFDDTYSQVIAVMNALAAQTFVIPYDDKFMLVSKQDVQDRMNWCRTAADLLVKMRDKVSALELETVSKKKVRR